MEKPITLIQLVSEQTLPNILPALALEPTKVVLCHTPKTKQHAKRICEALGKAGLTFSPTLVALGDFPTMEETAACLGSLLKSADVRETALVNLTGGTKLMSIGAYRAAAYHRVSSFYLDTAHHRIHDLATWALPDALRLDWSERERRAKERLSLEVVAAAQGVLSISAGLNPEPLMALALHLRDTPTEEGTLHMHFPMCDNLKKSQDVFAFLEKPVPRLTLSKRLFQLATEAGLFEQRGADFYFACPPELAALRERSLTNFNSVKKDWWSAFNKLCAAINLFHGGWWELAVFDAARRSGQFNELRWSVDVRVGNRDYEKDIVGLSNLNLAIFSCKRGGDAKDRLVKALEELDANARSVGGTHALKYLCVAMLHKVDPEQREVLLQLATDKQITLIGLRGLSADSFIP